MNIEMTDACKKYILDHADDIKDCIDDFDVLAEDLQNIHDEDKAQADFDNWNSGPQVIGLTFKL